jgi:hypothetical protein
VALPQTAWCHTTGLQNLLFAACQTSSKYFLLFFELVCTLQSSLNIYETPSRYNDEGVYPHKANNSGLLQFRINCSKINHFWLTAGFKSVSAGAPKKLR